MLSRFEFIDKVIRPAPLLSILNKSYKSISGFPSREGLVPIKKVVRSKKGRSFTMTYWIRPKDATIRERETEESSNPVGEEAKKAEKLQDFPYTDYQTFKELENVGQTHSVNPQYSIGKDDYSWANFFSYVMAQTVKLDTQLMNSASTIADMYPVIAGTRWMEALSYKPMSHHLNEHSREDMKADGEAGINEALKAAGMDDTIRKDVDVVNAESIEIPYPGLRTWGALVQRAWAERSSDDSGPQDWMMVEAFSRLSDDEKLKAEHSKGMKQVENDLQSIAESRSGGLFSEEIIDPTQKGFQDAKKAVTVAYDNIYGRTQQYFEDMGYTADDEITIFRGTSDTFFGRRASFAEKVEKNPEVILPREDFVIRPLSSWSLDPGVAADFSGTRGVVIATKVKVKDIFSHYITGFGCRNEQEVVVRSDAFSGVRIVYMGATAESELHRAVYYKTTGPSFETPLGKTTGEEPPEGHGEAFSEEIGKSKDIQSLEPDEYHADWIRVLEKRKKLNYVVLQKARPHKYMKKSRDFIILEKAHSQYIYTQECLEEEAENP